MKCEGCQKTISSSLDHSFSGYGYHVQFCVKCCPKHYDDQTCEYCQQNQLKIIAMGGVPASGKTTLVKRLLLKFRHEPFPKNMETVESFGKLKFHSFPRSRIAVLGLYDGGGEVFGGTDRLSMAVQPDAAKFLEYQTRRPTKEYDLIIFEGDRLFNRSFLAKCFDAGAVLGIVLDVDINTQKKRFKKRKSDQSATFLKGRRTKVENILRELPNVGRYDNKSTECENFVYGLILEFMEIE